MTLEEKTLQKAFGTPTPKQDEFYSAKTRYVGYGGAKGGGKSHAIRAKATYLAFAYPGIKILIVRRTLPELRENHTLRLQAVYNMFPAHMKPSYNGDEKAFTFPLSREQQRGSRIKLGYCANESDVLQYQGQEYDVLFIDEATQLSEYQFNWINAVVRGANDFPKRTYITCNPGGVGHAFVKETYIDKKLKRRQRKKDYTFIHAKIWDNQPLFNKDKGYLEALPWLMKLPEILINAIYSALKLDVDVSRSTEAAEEGDIKKAQKLLLDEIRVKQGTASRDEKIALEAVAATIKESIKGIPSVKKITPKLNRLAMEEADEVRKLKNLPEQLRRAWLEGDWSVFAGKYFTEFDEQVHITEPKEIPHSWRRSVSLDYGLDMLAVLWYAVDPYGNATCYRSFEQPELTASMAADKILRLTGIERIEEYIAPPDLWNRRNDTGRSVAEIFADFGLPLIKGGSSRIDGWLNVKEYLKVKDGKAKIVFFNTCEPIIHCLPLLQYDTKKINDVATEPHEITHSPDALRAWCARRQLTPEEVKEEKPDPFNMEKEETDDVSEKYLTGGFGNV